MPVDLGFGHAFSAHFVGQVQSYYTVAGAGKGDVEVLIALDFLP